MVKLVSRTWFFKVVLIVLNLTCVEMCSAYNIGSNAVTCVKLLCLNFRFRMVLFKLVGLFVFVVFGYEFFFVFCFVL